MNLKENYALTNNFLKEKKLTDPILQSIVFMGFMYGLSKEEICVCVFPDEGQPLSYMHCDYMRRALENGAALDEVKKVRDMTPEEAKVHRPSVVFVDEINRIDRVTNYEKHGQLFDKARLDEE